MKYNNAQDILPDKLLKELQQYVSGETLYVPNAQTKKAGARYRDPDVITRNATIESSKNLNQVLSWKI